MQHAGLLERRDLAFRFRDGDRAGRMGERGGKQIGAAEDRLAFREMLHRPGDGFRRRSPARRGPFHGRPPVA